MMIRNLRRFASIVLVLGFAISAAPAAAGVNPLFSDSMVLQCGMKTPVYGTAEKGAKITVVSLPNKEGLPASPFVTDRNFGKTK